jgi:gamma-glutamyl:cysteine ligase YbdK (ATP-grasp superfamily)
MRRTFPMIIVAAGLIAAGCGDSSDSTSDAEAEESSVSAKEAVTEINAVRNGLAASLTAYRNGDEAQAEELAAEAYLQHFELVEGPLEERDEELNEELEDQIREELREEIRDGAPVAKVAALVKKIDRELDEAERALES